MIGNEAADDLLAMAERERAALIVIGGRRRSPVGQVLMRSNVQSVLLRADGPALMVKAT
jgi:nucleotide-binding universal stress UspA family protein